MNVFDRVLRKSYPAGIDNVAVQKDFNRVDIEGMPPDVFEKSMADFENELAPVLRRTIEAERIQDDDDRAYLLNLIGLQALRNPRHRETLRDFHERLSKMILNVALSSREVWESQVRGAKAAGHMQPDADANYEMMKKFMTDGNFTIEVPNERHIQLEVETFDKILPYLFARGWMLLKAPVFSGGFITSDHPYCLLWTDPPARRIPPGLGKRNTEIVFPLSNRLALIGALELQNGFQEITESQVSDINGTVALFADRHVYARDLNFTYTIKKDQPNCKASKLIKDVHFLRPERKAKS